MFHNSTTLHHRRSDFGTSFTGKEKRLVHAASSLSYLERKKLQARVFWDYLRPVRKAGRLYSWTFGGPLIVKGADLTMKGAGHAVDGAEWTWHTAKEGAKGVFEMTAKPMAMLLWSRFVAIKRMLWDVPLATFSAAIRTPIAIAMSPFEMIGGVRDAIKSIPQNAKEVLNAASQLKIMDTIRGTRKAIGDVLLPPVTRPLAPVLQPSAHVVNTALGAELQTLTTLKTGVTETIPEGARRFWYAPRTATAIMNEIKAARAARKAALEEEKAQQAAMQEEMIRDYKGLPAKPANDNAVGGMKRAA